MMKTLVIALAVLFCMACGSSSDPNGLVHPGVSHTAKNFKTLTAKIKSGQEPWKSSWDSLMNSRFASLDYTAQPRSHVQRGYYAKPDVGATELMNDGIAAYTLSLRWVVEKDNAYAEKAIEILNGWSYTLDSITHDDRKLTIGMVGSHYINAAEIMRHLYKKWDRKDIDQFEKMILEVWYPVIQDFQPTFNGNWDAALGRTMMCIGIFSDRKDIFEKAYHHLLEGNTNGAIDNYFYPNGQCQESGRDQSHTQMGLGFLTQASEIARNQGYDLYSAYDNRLATGYEYTAKYMLGEEVPYERYVDFKGDTLFGPEISPQGRARLAPIYELAYRHYHDRMGMEMPYTKRAIEKTRPEQTHVWFLSWATLMNAGYEEN